MKRRVKNSQVSSEVNQSQETLEEPIKKRSFLDYLEWFAKVGLWEEIPAESMVVFRVFWGLIMCYESYTFITKDYAKMLYIVDLRVHFKYYGFAWAAHILPGNGMYILLWLMVAASLGVTVGFCYRFSSFMFFLMFSYLYLQEMTLYLNHFYLICILSFLFVFLNVGEVYSIDSLFKKEKKKTVPYWNLWLMKVLIFIVYTYAGLAKVNQDWLRGEPLIHWLPKRKAIPFLGYFLEQQWVAILFSYCGLLLDMFIAPALYVPYLRPLGFLALIFFHSMNKIIFNIGVFPWVMLASTMVFVDPVWISEVLTRKKYEAPTNKQPTPLNLKKKLIILGLVLFMAHQIVMPLRHWTYPGDVNWTEYGHRYSWRMKLRDKLGMARFYLFDPTHNDTQPINQNFLLTPRQQQKVSCRPELLHMFAHEIASIYEVRTNRRPKVTAEAICSLNYRPYQHMIKPGYDLAATPLWSWPYEWLVDLVPLGENSTWLADDPFKNTTNAR